MIEQFNAWLEIDLSKLQSNYKKVVDLAEGRKVLCVVKGNGYNHGLEVVVSSLLEVGADTFGVYTLEEADNVAEIADKADVLMIGPLLKSDLKEAVAKGYIIDLSTNDLVKDILKLENVRVNISIDMGFKRGDIKVEDVPAIVEQLKDKVELYGLSTHFPLPTNKERVQEQATSFNSLKELFPHFKHIHLESTASFMQGLGLGNMVRVGGALYGLVSYLDTDLKGLEQIVSFKSKVLLTSYAGEGDLVGYGDTASYDTKIALIGAGYSVGLDKDLTGKSYVFIRGEKCPILSVTMNSSIIAVPNNISSGDIVTITDSKFTLMEVSKLTGKRTYHLMYGFHCPVKYI